MPKRERGVPQDFKLDVPKSVLERTPPQPQDYLDQAVKEAAPPRPTETPPTTPPTRREPQWTDAAAPAPTARVVAFRSREPRPARRPPRAQVNLMVDAQAMFQELMEHFSRYGSQKDIASSELFEALIGALFDAKSELDLGTIPPRGQWGTPNARAFRTHLKRAVIDAIGRHYEKLPG